MRCRMTRTIRSGLVMAAELFYVAGPNRFVATSVTERSGLSFSNPSVDSDRRLEEHVRRPVDDQKL